MNNNIENATFLLRLALGSVALAHGLLKVLVITLPGTVGFFESFGLPGFLAYVVAFIEIVGGGLLLLGVAVRQVAIALVPVMLGATYVHFGNGWLFVSEHGGWEYPAYLTVAAIAQAMLGSGSFALKIPGDKS